MKKKAIFSWSGGKDSALALHEIRKNNGYEIVSLLTTFTKDYDRVSLHGTRRILLERQAESIGLPLHKIFIPKKASSEEYEQKMKKSLVKFQESGVSEVIFGDIFLEDLRKFREEKLSQVGMRAAFPIWKKDTRKLAHQFVELGFKAIVTCVDTKILAKKFAGRTIDEQLLAELPPTVDLCGENGEFHSFVSEGPIFRETIPYKLGKAVLRENRFFYFDLIDES